MTGAQSDRALGPPGRLADHLRLFRLQFALLPASSVVVGYLAGGGVSAGLLAVLTAATVAAHAASALFNAYSDHREDVVNMPEYAALVARVGRRRCRRLAELILAALTALCVAGLFLYPLPSLIAIVMSLGIVGYSLGPRLKRDALGSLGLMVLHVGWPFVLGWLVAAGGIGREGLAVAAVLGIFYAFGRTVRYLHDVPGDQVAGVANRFTRLAQRRAWGRFAALLLAPYAFTAVLAGFEVVPRRMLGILVLAPCVPLLVGAMRRTRTALQQAALFDWSTLYSLLVHVLLLVFFLPRPAVAGLALGAVGAKLAIAHWGLDYRTRLPLPRLLAVRFSEVGTPRAPDSGGAGTADDLEAAEGYTAWLGRPLIRRAGGRIAFALFNGPLFTQWRRLGLAPGDRVLDLGCGAGTLLSFLDRRLGFAAPPVGVDASHGQMRLAAELRDRHGGGRGAALVQASAGELPLAPARFDAVLSSHVLHNLDDGLLDRALAEARRVLRPGGRLLCWTFGSRSARYNRIARALLNAVMRPPTAIRRHTWLRTEHEIAAAIERAGFERPRRLRLAGFLWPPGCPRVCFEAVRPAGGGAGARE